MRALVASRVLRDLGLTGFAVRRAFNARKYGVNGVTVLGRGIQTSLCQCSRRDGSHHRRTQTDIAESGQGSSVLEPSAALRNVLLKH